MPGQEGDGVALKARITLGATRLLAHADTGLLRFGLLLLAADLLLIGVFLGDGLARALPDAQVPDLGRRWRISSDRSYLEILGYVKLAIAAAALATIRPWRYWPGYPTLVPLILFMLVDDAFRIHERLGRRLAAALDLERFAGLRGQDYGELIVWAGFGLLLAPAAIVGFVRSHPLDRGNVLMLLGSFVLLAFFGVVVDMVHVTVTDNLRASDSLRSASDTLLAALEDGGEQIALTLLCLLALLVHREVRSRHAAKVSRARQGTFA
jgi:hypothetical protein